MTIADLLFLTGRRLYVRLEPPLTLRDSTLWLYFSIYDAGLRGRLPVFIENFLRDRKFKVQLGSEYSDSLDQEYFVLTGLVHLHSQPF